MRFLQRLRGLKSVDVVAEIIAGATLAALAITLNIGYAEVAPLPPVAGLYAAVRPQPSTHSSAPLASSFRNGLRPSRR